MPSEVIHFGDFELDPGAFELRRSGRVVRLERIPLELLLFLGITSGLRVIRSRTTATRRQTSILLGDPSKPDKLCNHAALRSNTGALDICPFDSAAWGLCRLQVHATAVSVSPSWRSRLPNRNHCLDRSLAGGPRVSLGATR
jgi:hypothetical protein